MRSSFGKLTSLALVSLSLFGHGNFGCNSGDTRMKSFGHLAALMGSEGLQIEQLARESQAAWGGLAALMAREGLRLEELGREAEAARDECVDDGWMDRYSCAKYGYADSARCG